MKRGRGRDHWKVLIAEDNDDHALLIEMALERSSGIPIEVHRARNGDEAIILVEDVRPDLILLDLKMPGRSGHEVLEVIKGDDEFRRIPVAVLTSSDRAKDMAKSYGLGSNHFITKSEDPAELERQLRRLLKHMLPLSGRRGANRLEATGAAGTHRMSVIRQLIRWVAVLAVLGGLVAFAQFVGLF